jgi:hypothetical protein
VERKIYLIGSMRNPEIPVLGNRLRELGHDVHDDWYSPGPEADDRWREYEILRGRDYAAAMNGRHAKEVFDFDKRWIDYSDTIVLLRPAGISGHLELGYAAGQGKETHVILDDSNRWDIMLRFADHIWRNIDEFLEALRG